MPKMLLELLDAIGTLLVGLVPGAIGASVSLVWEKGLTWGQRFLQLAVGIVVSFYVTRMLASGLHLYTGKPLEPFFLDGIKFTIGLIAFKATPGFITACVDVIASLPGRARDKWFPKGDGQ